jgi:MSHA biogenesis protein MshP
MSVTCPKYGRRQTGFSLVTAIFLLVILAALGAAMVRFSGAQQTTVAMDIQSARAHQAARAGIEWGAYRALKEPAFSCAGTPFSLSFSGANLNGFTTEVACSSTSHNEGSNTITLFEFRANTRYGTANTPDYVARELSARVARCIDPGGVAC